MISMGVNWTEHRSSTRLLALLARGMANSSTLRNAWLTILFLTEDIQTAMGFGAQGGG